MREDDERPGRAHLDEEALELQRVGVGDGEDVADDVALALPPIREEVVSVWLDTDEIRVYREVLLERMHG